MKKNILFRPQDKLVQEIIDPPKPTTIFFPKWYKNLSQYTNKENKLKIFNHSINATAKKCIPLMDSITAGYTVTVPADIQVSTDENGNKVLSWATKDYQLVELHDPKQIENYPISNEYSSQPFKMIGFWGIQTPKGYSLLIMHPLGRFDLPFYSFHAIVDSDLHYVPLNIPFLLKKDFNGVIEKGTPLVQVIPIKRNIWISKIKNYNDFNPFIVLSKISLYLERWYKENIWIKKDYR